jgi:hypothetical protein
MVDSRFLESEDRPKPLRIPAPRGSSQEIRDIMNFMNFAFRPRPFGALEFVERLATSEPE